MQKLIQNVQIKELKTIYDDRGFLQELVRESDFTDEKEQFLPIKQSYITEADKGVIKAFHRHQKQWDRFVCINGKMKVILLDTRHTSSTCGLVNEFILQNRNIALLIPPLVMHGFKALQNNSIILNHPSEEYNYENPDEERFYYNQSFYILKNGKVKLSSNSNNVKKSIRYSDNATGFITTNTYSWNIENR